MPSANFDSLVVQFSRLIEDPVAAASTDGDAHTSAFRVQCLNEGVKRCLVRWVAENRQDALREYIATEPQTLAASVKALSSWTGGVQAVLSAYNSTDAQIVLPLSNALTQQGLYGNNKYILATGTAGTVVSGATFSASSTAITSFAGSGVLATHVGGQFIGLDSGGTPFVRTITAYVSSSAFTINAALGADGAGTSGFIVPLAASTNQKYRLHAGNFVLMGGTATSAVSLTYVKQHTDLTVNNSTDLAIPSQYFPEVLDEAFIYFCEQVPSQENTVKLGMKRGATKR